MSTGSCFWNTHAFMQSLQMRWPVAAIIGLSTAMAAKAPSRQPCARSACISLIFSSSGQPARVTPNVDFWYAPVLRSRRPLLHESFDWTWHQMQ